jgi:hypothetical protein
MNEKEQANTLGELSADEIYLRIWEKQQDWTSTRWNIAIFFFSVSFALFGLSFQDSGSSVICLRFSMIFSALTRYSTAVELYQ